MSFFGLKALDLAKKEFDFSHLKGKVTLIVNVASKCGYTPQYSGLQKVYEKYSTKGLEVIGFPCNQFGAQEPGSNEQIGDFCKKNYGVSFKIMDKIEVNGNGTHPVYKFLKESKKVSQIGWNFEKFLVDKSGNVVGHYKSSTSPEQLESEIEKLLV